MSDEPKPIGLDTIPAFRSYVREFCRKFPADPEMATKHGVIPGNGRSHTTVAKIDTDETAQQTNYSRRGFNKRVAVGAPTVATVDAGTAAA